MLVESVAIAAKDLHLTIVSEAVVACREVGLVVVVGGFAGSAACVSHHGILLWCVCHRNTSNDGRPGGWGRAADCNGHRG